MPRDATCLVCGKTGDRRFMDVSQRCQKCASKRRVVPIERRLPEDQPDMGDEAVTVPAQT